MNILSVWSVRDDSGRRALPCYRVIGTRAAAFNATKLPIGIFAALRREPFHRRAYLRRS